MKKRLAIHLLFSMSIILLVALMAGCSTTGRVGPEGTAKAWASFSGLKSKMERGGREAKKRFAGNEAKTKEAKKLYNDVVDADKALIGGVTGALLLGYDSLDLTDEQKALQDAANKFYDYIEKDLSETPGEKIAKDRVVENKGWIEDIIKGLAEAGVIIWEANKHEKRETINNAIKNLEELQLTVWDQLPAN